jgi:leucyl aminopeptidase
LIGKGVTFDSGGISIKPAQAMEEMKYDKCGACAVLGVARAVADLRLPVRLQAYLPLAENMLSGSACRPGDIIRCYNGKTVEIINTDAEGRLMLADALSLAVEQGAEHVLEYSTLTGACTIALGRLAAGLYTPDDAMAGELLAAADLAGERLWRMPLWPELFDLIKGCHADLKNSSERWGSSNLAATFLAQFVEPLGRWAHLDIAGPVNTSHDGPGGVGATGYGVGLSIAWLRSLAGR